MTRCDSKLSELLQILQIIGVRSEEGGSAPSPAKKTLHYTKKNNKLLPQRQHTAVIKSNSTGEYDVNETSKTLQKLQ